MNNKVLFGVILGLVVVVVLGILFFAGDVFVFEDREYSDLEETGNLEASSDKVLGEEEKGSEIVEESVVNGKTLSERLDLAYSNLHGEGSADEVRENFPDIEVVFVDNDDRYPSEILPFEYFYSAEADKTFSLCAIDRTVFICNGKLEERITEEQLNDPQKCSVTPVYTDYER